MEPGNLHFQQLSSNTGIVGQQTALWVASLLYCLWKFSDFSFVPKKSFAIGKGNHEIVSWWSIDKDFTFWWEWPIRSFAEILSFSNLSSWTLKGPHVLRKKFIFCVLHLVKYYEKKIDIRHILSHQHTNLWEYCYVVLAPRNLRKCQLSLIQCFWEWGPWIPV